MVPVIAGQCEEGRKRDVVKVDSLNTADMTNMMMKTMRK